MGVIISIEALKNKIIVFGVEWKYLEFKLYIYIFFNQTNLMNFHTTNYIYRFFDVYTYFIHII